MAKAITKLEHRVWDLSEKLSALTEKHIQYGNDNAFYRYYSISRGKIHCLECGHKWKGNLKNKQQTCPSCNKRLKMAENQTWVRRQGYLMVMDRIEEFQVLRYLYINKWMKKGQAPKYDSFETSQVFIRPDGKVTIMGADRYPMGAYYSPQWKYGSELSIKRHNNRFYDNKYTELYSCLYPSKKIIPELKRNGFKQSFYMQNPTEMVQCLLQNPILETLLKRREIELFQQGVKYFYNIENYWKELKITFRKNYKIADYIMWRDYIDMLKADGKDTLNPIYTCPEDLHYAHTIAMQRKQRLLDKEKRQQREKQIQEARENVGEWRQKYPELRKAFLNWSAKHEHITLQVITSVEQLEMESTMLDHCAFVNGYYARPESLLLSARVDGVVTETIEINLQRMEIIQARGFDNKATGYNAKIVKLVQDNIPEIHKLYKEQLKLSA